MELYPGAYQIASLFEGRNLFQYLLVGDSTVLVDTGIASTPAATIFPFLSQLGLRPERLTFAINSHVDVDHVGGNSSLKQVSPGTVLACGTADQEMIEDPQVLWDLHYNHLVIDHGVGLGPGPSPDSGKPQKVDLTLSGGERIRIRKDWQIEVLHVPGHSHGHLALYDAGRKAAFIGDAAQGGGCPGAGGSMALPVTYYYVDEYLSTLTFLESLPIDTLYTAHWPILRHGEVADFLSASRLTVTVLDEVILASLKQNPSGCTLKRLIDMAGHAFPDWPADTLVSAMFPLMGHMERLEEFGKVRLVCDESPFRWLLR